MFYNALYGELGKLFYHIAAVDGKITDEEKQTLRDLIRQTWAPLEDSVDRFGTERAFIIDYAFDFEEAEGSGEDAIERFGEFYRENRDSFDAGMINKIIDTARAIAKATRGKNKAEAEALDRLTAIFN